MCQNHMIKCHVVCWLGQSFTSALKEACTNMTVFPVFLI